MLFSQLDGGLAAPCANCDHHNGLLFNGGESFEPNGTYYRSDSFGYHNGWLCGPAAGDFDLYLWRLRSTLTLTEC